MTKPILLLLVTIAVFELSNMILGYDLAYRVGYGAFVLLALVIAGTFLWLWKQRSTPLALGMVFSWAGASCVMAWWWLYSLLGAPVWMHDNPLLFVFLSVYLMGAALHLEVIGRSFALSRFATFAPIAGAVLISLVVSLMA
ncbi:MAG: hypothetical protein AAGK71_01745 [Pseudomonadota bacterium]